MMNNKSVIIIIAILAVVLGLFALPKITNPNRNLIKKWKDAGLDCLPSHTNANLHIHPILKIFVDGEEEVIPVNVGIVGSCLAEVHTHDTTGTIHVESVLAGKVFTLGDFFAAWDKEIERPGFTLELVVDGQPNQEVGDLILRDRQQIIFNYIR